jgi:hypothetical protein
MSAVGLAPALHYASSGWPVLCLHGVTKPGDKSGPNRAECTCRRPDCASQGKHPRTLHGLDDATTDVDTISAWWGRWPDSNVGLLTGVAFDVVDIDGDLGRASFASASAGHPPIVTLRAKTGNGEHLLFTPTGAPSRVAILPGVDFRGRGGYIVAPPSLHYSGVRYEWLPGPGRPATSPGLADFATHRTRQAPTPPRFASPRRCAHSPRTAAYFAAALDREVATLAATPEGQRNATLNRCAFALGQLVAEGGLDARDVAGHLLATASAIGLGDSEAVATIRSGMAAGIANPRAART